MTDYEPKTNEELNELAALRCGWIECKPKPCRGEEAPALFNYWYNTRLDEEEDDLPDYTHSLDACLRDYVPVLMELNRQIDMSFYFDDGTGLHKWIWTCDIADGDYSAYDTNPARAFTIAFLESTERG